MNESIEQIETFAREMLLPAREPNESEEAFRGRVAKSSTGILIELVVSGPIAQARLAGPIEKISGKNK